MSQKAKIKLFLGFAIICWLAISCWAMYTHQQGSAVDPIYDTIHGNIHNENDTFHIYQGEDVKEYNEILGAVIANPLNNSSSTGETMAVLRESLNSGTLVLIAFGSDVGSEAITGDWSWQGSYGVVTVDKKVIEELQTKGMSADNTLLDEVSDISIIIDYCSYYLPGVSLVPIVLDSSAGFDEIAAALQPYRSILVNYPLLVVAPGAADESQLAPGFAGGFNTVADLVNTNLGTIVNSEGARALTVFASLLSQNAKLDIYGSSEETGEDSVPEPKYFSDLQIICSQ